MKQSFAVATLLLLSSASFAHAPAGDKVASTTVASAETDLDKKVCRKSVETGTLSKRSKTCMTRRQWMAQSDDIKQTWEELQGSKGMTAGQ